jgi:hypothetical protein
VILNIVVGVQAATMIVVGSAFLAQGEWRLGVAQMLLAVVTAVLYTGRGLG